MEYLKYFEYCIAYMQELNIWSMMLRVALAMLMGGIVGFERERKGRAAGFRTYMLVAMGSALTVMLSQYLDYMLTHDWVVKAEAMGLRTDASRFAAQVINGVGFLGAGTVIVTGRQDVKGLTTAAGLWASACMGIAIGAGFYECMIVAILLIVFCMKLLPGIERGIIARARNLSINISMDSFEDLGSIISCMKTAGLTIYDMEIEKEKGSHVTELRVYFSVRLPKRLSHEEILAALSTINGVVAIDEA